ncbi:MAG: c-type cytochrome [Opitutaceae bacterium]|nr:c-type cytochrome [Opitutaceae bacterium]
MTGAAGCVSAAAFLFSIAASAAVDPSNQRGDAPNARLVPAAGQREAFHAPAGFEVQLVAAEPEIQKPFNLAFDAQGRVWVTGSTLYPWPAKRDALDQPISSFQKQRDDNPLAFRAAATPPEPEEHGADTVRILSDFDPVTGRARKVTVFADGLNIPIGILPLPRAPEARGDSALVYSIPAIWRFTDTDGDGRADRREKLYDGFGFADTHGMSSSYWLWYDGWVYGTHGYRNVSEIHDARGRTTTLQSGNTYRFRPDGSRFEIFSNGQTNPFGLAFDPRGNVYTADSHSKPVYLVLPGGYYEGLNRSHDGLGFAPPITLDPHGSTGIAGIAYYAATHFPAEFRGNLFNGNPVTGRINRDRLDWSGSSPAAVRRPDFLTCADRAFRPVQVKLGPDGALWIADFYNPIIGHYEVPLTHPKRDRTHGRIWRVIWRGRDGSIAPPRLPDLTREGIEALVSRLKDPNLVVRCLAASELLARPDAAQATAALQSVASHLIAGAEPAADETAALAVLFALERMGRLEPAVIERALARRESDVAIAALRVLAARDALPADASKLFGALLALPAPETAARITAEIFHRQPQPWQPPLILPLLAKVPAADVELEYALRLALKANALTADVATLARWAGAEAATATRVADVCLGVPTAAAAEFLLGHLERSKFGSARAGDYARHAALNLPPERMAELEPLLTALGRAPLAQRFALAEGFAVVATKRDRTLPASLQRWMREELVAALAEKDMTLVMRAIAAVKDLSLPGKGAALRGIILAPKILDRFRTPAIRALEPNTPETDEIAGEVLRGNASGALKRAAADVLGTGKTSPAARAALVAAFPSASADLALGLATALVKSDAGAAELIDLVEAGRARAALLNHRHVVLALERRPVALRERAAALTRGLAPEDARIDALIAQRIGAAAGAKGNVGRGATVFATHCASCHRIHDAGGNIGPNLDGVGSRDLPRLIEDILDPNRNVDPAFRLATVTLRNGDVKSGINLREQPDQVVLTDLSSIQDVTVGRSDVASIAVAGASAMPAAFDTVISEPEFFDLLEFLRAPGRP